MNVRMHATLPAEWATRVPVRAYDTRFLYLGFRRYDTTANMISGFQRQSDGSFQYDETQHDGTVLPRAYAAEHVRVVIYSESPRVWVEELSPHERFVFVQQPTQAD
jgi:hypothetical protein